MARSSFGHIQYISHHRYKVYWQEDGRQRTKRIKGTRDDAESFLARVRGGSGSVTDCTYSEYWIRYVVPTFGTIAPRTAKGYRQIWAHDLKPAIGPMLVGSTDWRTVQRVLDGIQSPSVQRAAYRLWSKICNMAVRDGILTMNPVNRSIKLRPLRKKPKELYTPTELMDVLHLYCGKYRYLLILELCAGLRHEEACAVMRGDVRYEAGRAIVSVSKALSVVDGIRYLKETKTAFSEREVPLSEPFASMLGECWMPENERQLVLPTTATHNWRDWCRDHGVKYVPFGTMRSNFATLACECCDSSLVSLYMGHSDGTTRGRNYQQSTMRGMCIVADDFSVYLTTYTGELLPLESV